jgi:hypothetical protein
VATVCTGLGVATKTGHEGEVEVENILEPLDGSRGLVGEDLDEVGACLVTGRLEGIIVELLDAVCDSGVYLCAGESTVDARSGLCGVAAEETCVAMPSQYAR